MPKVSAGAVGAMMAAIVASMLDSCGDYIAYARTMGYPLPPKHAVNRGIAMEGLATVISGMYDNGQFTQMSWTSKGYVWDHMMYLDLNLLEGSKGDPGAFLVSSREVPITLRSGVG